MDDRNSIISAFSEEQTERLTGVSKTQLRYWDRTDFYHPSYAEENRRLPFSRIYSFKDIVALRVLNVLRNQYNVSLQHLREVSVRLSHLEDDRWTGIKLWVLDRRVVWQEPDTELPQEIVSQQYVVTTLELQRVVADTKRDIQTLNGRSRSKVGKLEKSRYVNQNATVVAGTRISVDAICRFSEAGYSVEQIMEEFPGLTEKDIAAALEHKKDRSAA